jgi:uncharacterized membrane protein YeaQ/YmgE (transglycosylase-associated protein family)
VGILSWIAFGLLAGLVARIVVPGQHRLGCLTTILVGVLGAFLGGLIGDVILDHKVRFHWAWGPFLLAVAGATLLLLVLEALAGRLGSGGRQRR